MTDFDDLIGSPINTDGLTPIEEEFVFYYTAEGLSANESYRKATGSTLSPQKIGTAAARIFRRPKVKARIAQIRRERVTKMIMSKVDVLNALARIAAFDVRNLYDDNGDLIPLHELDDVTAASIVSIEAQRLNTPTADDPTKTTLLTAKVKLADKKAALDSLAKALGMFTEKVELTGKEGKDLIPDEMSQTELARRVAFLLTSGVRQTDK